MSLHSIINAQYVQFDECYRDLITIKYMKTNMSSWRWEETSELNTICIQLLGLGA